MVSLAPKTMSWWVLENDELEESPNSISTRGPLFSEYGVDVFDTEQGKGLHWSKDGGAPMTRKASDDDDEASFAWIYEGDGPVRKCDVILRWEYHSFTDCVDEGYEGVMVGSCTVVQRFVGNRVQTPISIEEARFLHYETISLVKNIWRLWDENAIIHFHTVEPTVKNYISDICEECGEIVEHHKKTCSAMKWITDSVSI